MTALHLLNADTVDAVPAGLLRVRRSSEARALHRASWILRRKHDGRFLAALLEREGVYRLQPLHPRLDGERRGVDAILAMLGLQRAAPLRPRGVTGLQRRAQARPLLPSLQHWLRALQTGLHRLGIDPQQYRCETGLSLFPEPPSLDFAGRDRYRRPLWLLPAAASAYARMCNAATHEGIALEAISGFRSVAYQHGIFRRKLARGKPLAQILCENAAPGFSEHHSGRAIDLSTPGEPAAEESFERTPAFAWLQANAARFGFRMSYPRNNPHGILYEPWHWCWHDAAGAAL